MIYPTNEEEMQRHPEALKQMEAYIVLNCERSKYIIMMRRDYKEAMMAAYVDGFNKGSDGGPPCTCKCHTVEPKTKCPGKRHFPWHGQLECEFEDGHDGNHRKIIYCHPFEW